MDFSSFYASALAYTQGTNPYHSIVASYFLIPIKLPANLNPPFFLQLFSPFTYLNFKWASSLWFLCSLIFGNIGALLCFKLSCSEEFFKKNRLFLVFVYLGMYSTVMNTGIGQIGGFLLFFVMAGYYFYLQKQDCITGIFWGVIIAIKLFPALLFIFMLSQKRYLVFFITAICSVLASLLPLFDRPELYSLYFNMLTRMLWFGDNWNGSLYGFIFRLFVNIKSYQNLEMIKIIFLLFFIILSIWYGYTINFFRKTTKSNPQSDHRAFCLTLVMMLLMSPLGWLYYFSLLIMPLTIIWQSFNHDKLRSNNVVLPWVLSLFLINFPLGYIESSSMHSIIYKLTIYSPYFYGLVIIAYLLSRIDESILPSRIGELNNINYLHSLYLSLGLGVFITLSSFIVHLIHTQYHNITAAY
nr:glycosyltransferase family 87 protein [Legionella antarctica]